jgi:H+-transporting ATPase
MTNGSEEALPAGLTDAEAQAQLARDGPNEVAPRRTHPLARFAAKLWGLPAWMLEAIALLSLALRKWDDFWVALALLAINAVISFLQEQRASAAVDALRQRMQVTARVRRGGVWRALAARELVRDDAVRLRAGDFVPADVRVLDGTLRVDQSTLTGESRDLDKSAGDTVYSGSIVRAGEATGVVVATGAATYYGRTTQLVDTARPKLHVEEAVTRVVRWLLAIVGLQVIVVLVGSFGEGLPPLDTLALALVLLMSAVPVALPVMFTVSMAIGAVELSRRGVLVTRLSAAEDAANMDILCADKTGTLTQNRLSLAGTLPQPGFEEVDVIRAGAQASNDADQDPIDLAFLRAAQERGLFRSPVCRVAFEPFSAQTRRTEARVEEEGRRVRVLKGALATIAELCAVDAATRLQLQGIAEDQARRGYRVLAVARAQADAVPRLVGLALLHDPPRPDSRALIGELHALGVGVRMLTGDAAPIAREVAHALGVTDFAAEVLPEGKYTVVKELQQRGHVVGMTGDGVNDAPALRQAEVGIAVAGATDVARAAASVVLTGEGLACIVDLVKGGRAIYQRVLTWIVNKVNTAILKSAFVTLPFVVTGKLVISALGMVLLLLLTDFVKIALATDRVRASPMPETWEIGPQIRVAVVLGLLMLVEALALLAFGWHRFGLDRSDGLRESFSFLTLLFFSLASVLSVRERRAFWSSRPSGALAAALASAAAGGFVIAALGLGRLAPLPMAQTALIASVALAASLLVNDPIKRVLLARWASRTRAA